MALLFPDQGSSKAIFQKSDSRFSYIYPDEKSPKSSKTSDTESEYHTNLFEHFGADVASNFINLLQNSVDLTEFKLFQNIDPSSFTNHLRTTNEFEDQLNVRQLELDKFLSISHILVSNCKAVDNNIQRKFKCDYLNIYSKMLQAIDNQTIESEKKYAEIMERIKKIRACSWDTIDLEEFNFLKIKANEIIESKNEIFKLGMCQLKVMNEQFAMTASKFTNQLGNFFARLEALRKLVLNTFANHLEIVHLYIAQENSKRLRNIEKNVQELFTNFALTRDKFSAIVHEKHIVYNENLERFRRQQMAITKEVLHRQDAVVECVQREMLDLKNENIINWEKIEWNYLVLKRREEENHIILNQQKRRIHKMVDSIRVLRNILKNAKESGQVKINKLQKSLERLHGTISASEKYNQFRKKKLLDDFITVWQLNSDEAREQLLKIMNIDRIVFEQLLNIKWQSRTLDIKPIAFISYYDRAQSNQKKLTRLSNSNLNQKLSRYSLRACRYEREHLNKQVVEVGLSDEQRRQLRFLRNMLRQIADSAGNIIEQKLLQVLMTSEEPKTLLRIENIFNMLQVNDSKDLQVLADIFKPYAKCPYCSPDISPELLHKFCLDNGLKKISQLSPNKGVCTRHTLLVEPMTVLTALRKFKEHTQNIKAPSNEQLNKIRHQTDILKMLPKNDEIIAYWQNIISFVPQGTSALWQTLEHYQLNFYEELKQRQKLLDECKRLRLQNFQMRFLLSKQKVQK